MLQEIESRSLYLSLMMQREAAAIEMPVMNKKVCGLIIILCGLTITKTKIKPIKENKHNDCHRQM